MSIVLRIISMLTLLAYSEPYFTDDFNNWLKSYYGNDVQRILNRADLGEFGSFGGKSHPREIISRQPIIIVHGVSDRAHDKPLTAAKYFLAHGYRWSELYSTTYENGAQGNPLQWMHYTMHCTTVKQIRALIVAVRLYTGRQVDVISYSLGVPITRKAILGGNCVDTHEYLGRPLTRFIDTFVGVAGPNHGVAPQIGGLGVPGCMISSIPICNTQTGLYSGICPIESVFLQDINFQEDYEGQFVFSIYSKRDQIVGHIVCNRVTTRVPGRGGEKVYQDLNHDRTFYDSFDVQKSMITDHVII